MGFFKNVVKAVAAPVKAAVSVVTNTAQGNIGDAAKAAVSGVTSLSPVTMVENVSGGKLSQATSFVPIVGSMGSKFISSSGTIGGSNGDFAGSDLRTYLREGTKLGAIAAGGSFLAPTLGVTGSLTAAGIGSQLGSGNIRGALGSAINSYTPEGFEGLGGVAQTLIQKRQPASNPIFEGSNTPLDFGSVEGPSVLMIGALAIGSIFLIKAIKKGHK